MLAGTFSCTIEGYSLSKRSRGMPWQHIKHRLCVSFFFFLSLQLFLFILIKPFLQIIVVVVVKLDLLKKVAGQGRVLEEGWCPPSWGPYESLSMISQGPPLGTRERPHTPGVCCESPSRVVLTAWSFSTKTQIPPRNAGVGTALLALDPLPLLCHSFGGSSEPDDPRP